MTIKGNCYQVACEVILGFSEGCAYEEGMVLVHGIPTGQGPIAGVRHGHAWIELEDQVIDISNGKNLRCPKVVYYAIGNIREEECIRYSREEARRWVLETEIWGPWELEVEN